MPHPDRDVAVLRAERDLLERTNSRLVDKCTQLRGERDLANRIAADLRDERARLFVECGRYRAALETIGDSPPTTLTSELRRVVTVALATARDDHE